MDDPVSERILIHAGRRTGRTFDNEREFLNALDAGKQVFTTRNGVYFEVTADTQGVRYTALAEKPQGV